jgi:hypothetical protein
MSAFIHTARSTSIMFRRGAQRAPKKTRNLLSLCFSKQKHNSRLLPKCKMPMVSNFACYSPFLFLWSLTLAGTHNSGVGTAFCRSLQFQLGSVTRRLHSQHFSAVTCYRLRIWSDPPHSAVRYTWQHLWVRLCTTWPDRNRPRSTRIQLAHPVLNPLHSVLLTGFHPNFTRKGICYSGSIWALVHCKSAESLHCPLQTYPGITSDSHKILTIFQKRFAFNQCYKCVHVSCAILLCCLNKLKQKNQNFHAGGDSTFPREWRTLRSAKLHNYT